MKKILFSVILFISIVVLASIPNAADLEPVDQAIQIDFNRIKNLKIENVFRELQQEDLYYNEDLFESAVAEAFKSRKRQAVEYVTNFLKRPRYKNDEGEGNLANTNFMVAKRILRSFSNESIGHLRKIYKAADTTTKGNIIEVLGTIPDTGDKVVENLLLDALDDQSFYDEEDSEMTGWPLRVCDAAYNQSVLRYKIKTDIRTLGTIHSIETRNHQIALLKDQL